MYKKHAFCTFFLGIVVMVVSWYFDLHYKVIASDAITFVSIAIAVYMAAITLPLGNKASDYMRMKDKYIPHKTHMGILCVYLKCAISVGFLSIIDSCLILVISDITLIDDDGRQQEIYPLLCSILSAIGFSLLAVNMLFALIIFKYIIISTLNNSNSQT